MSYCEKHEIDHCSLCKSHVVTRPKVDGSRPRFRRGDPLVITSQYESRCPECCDDILIGDLIIRSLDDLGWIHKDCQ